ncbi:aminoglycoside phosphotransferase family protein [Streptomyces laurentii]|uniref:aminoglycoside phosphotransferase family protein n=1 Tax=Streptomyces laurentii TaxID=39478 RepID=UPI0033CCBBCE
MLPPVETDDDWRTVVSDESVMRPGARDLCARLGLGDVPLTRFAEGSQPVYAVGDELVLKLFPGSAAQDGIAEARVLSHVQGRLPVETPRVRDAGAYENGWRYVLMSRLPGENLAHVWDRAPRGEQERMVTGIGESLAVLHALDHGSLADVIGPGDWGAFVDRQRAGAVRRQRDRGLPPVWLDRIEDFLTSVPLPRAPRPSLLHTEVMRQHFFADPGTWRLTGFYDFEPAMIGDRAYDFVGVGLFVTRGDPALLGRLFRAYGETFDPSVLLAYTLLHVYSNLPWYLRELGVTGEPELPALAESWFGTA